MTLGKNFKELEMEIETDLNHIISGNSNIFNMVSEIIDNSLGSLGINISKSESKIENTIEIYFKNYIENNLKKTNMTITDDCGGINNSEENIKNVMTYGRRKESYTEPFFNVFGQGLKYSAIWSAKKLKLISKQGEGNYLDIRVSWLENQKNGKPNYYCNINDLLEIKYIGDTLKKADFGTQVIFEDLYKEGQKYQQSSIQSLYKFLGWRYSKYIKKGLNLTIYHEDADGQMLYQFSGMKKGTSKILPENPRYESFKKYFDFISSKNSNMNIKRDEYNKFILDFLTPKIKNANLKKWLEECVLKDKELKFKENFVTNYRGQEIEFPIEVGIVEFSKYENASTYEEVYGLCVSQADRYLEHGPRSKDSGINPNKPRDFQSQKSFSGGKSSTRRFVGEIIIDDYVSKFYDKNVLTNNKEFFKIDEEVFGEILKYISSEICRNLLDFLNGLKDIQNDNLFLKHLKSSKKVNDVIDSYPNNNIPVKNEDVVLVDGADNNIDDINLDTLINAKNNDLIIVLVPEKMENEIFREQIKFRDSELNYLELFINEEVYNKYSFAKTNEFKDFIANLVFKEFINKNKENKSDPRFVKISKILDMKGK